MDDRPHSMDCGLQLRMLTRAVSGCSHIQQPRRSEDGLGGRGVPICSSRPSEPIPLAFSQTHMGRQGNCSISVMAEPGSPILR